MNFSRLTTFGIFIIFITFACTRNSKNQISEAPNMNNIDFTLPEWAKNVNIYEVNIRQYTPEGTFKAFQKHLPRLKDMGVDVLWFMPIYPISETKKKGSLGSYYAVSDFRATNPNFGTIEDFSAIIEEAHSLEMKVILDWVPNHTGWDHIWMKTNSDFYTKDSLGNIVDPLNEHGQSMGWTDVADLNYGNKTLWEAMKNDMIFWLKEYKIDGFRHDMAMLVPLEFWQQTIPALREVKSDIFLLAESEEHSHLNENCFHCIYAWSLHHTLNDIARGNKKSSAIDMWLANEKVKAKKGLYMHFTSNHDENSWSGSEIERMGPAHQAFAVLVNTMDGIPLTYSGQEEPMEKRLQFFEKDDIGFEKYKYHEFYKKLNNLRHSNQALWHSNYGGEIIKLFNHDDIFAFTRSKGEYNISVIINLSNNKQAIKLNSAVKGKDIFTDKTLELNIGDNLEMEPWSFLVLN